MRYVSCFSGIGGLEASVPPLLLCEQDTATASVLQVSHPGVPVWSDVCTLKPPLADVVAGGWPCQDVSIAGKQAGLKGLRSGLLRELLRVAVEAGAHTVVAENVANLLRMRSGEEFRASLEEFRLRGFPFVGWRLLNTREFGLPQHRSRLLIVASQDRTVVDTLFRDVLPQREVVVFDASREDAAGFYWTAGIHSINYTRGYVPTIKIGSSLGIASPPAVHYGHVVRPLSPDEALSLQGFDLTEADFPSRALAYKAAGNAVARDIGRWVLDGLFSQSPSQVELVPEQMSLFERHELTGFPKAGISLEGVVRGVSVSSGPAAGNLSDFLDRSSEDSLSPRAAAGLLRRLGKSQQPCPDDLLASLRRISATDQP